MALPWALRIYTPQGLVKEDILGGKRALDVGCGSRKLPGSTGMDRVKDTAADVIHDIEKAPWPFENNSFDLVFSSHTFEHADDLLKVLSEVHRILKPGGRLVFQVPYFRSVDAFTDITHRRFFTSGSMEYVLQGTKLADYHYVPFRFKKIGLWYGWPHPSQNGFVRLFKKYIAKYSRVYDQYLSLLFPVACLTWELEKTD